MPDTPSERFVTNLGSVPDGMSFLEAVAAAKPLRKYEINPAHESRRLTVCEMQREIWRIADTLPEPARTRLQLLAGAAFDCGKRMNARLVELREAVECSK